MKGFHIDRHSFDTALVQHASQQGIPIVEEGVTEFLTDDGCVVGIITDQGRKIISRYVVDASGMARLAGRRLHFKEDFFSRPLISWTSVSSGQHEKDRFYKSGFAAFVPSAQGWTWIAPLYDGRCAWTRLSLKGQDILATPDLLDGCERLEKAGVYNLRWRLFKSVCQKGIILCGDAAGVIDPAAGQGILNALYFGIMAVRMVSKILMDPENEDSILHQYDSLLREQYLAKMARLKEQYLKLGIHLLDELP